MMTGRYSRSRSSALAALVLSLVVVGSCLSPLLGAAPSWAESTRTALERPAETGDPLSPIVAGLAVMLILAGATLIALLRRRRT